MTDPTRTLQVPRRGAKHAPSLRVVVTSGPDAPRTIAPGKPRALAGRDAAADVALSDPTVSLFHVELEATADGVHVRDLDSHNGTLASDVRIEAALVPYGAELALGATRIVVERAEDVVHERSGATSFGAMVGASPAIREVYAVLERLAGSDVSVCIEGARGTGKKTAARGLHTEGARKERPFVLLDCAALVGRSIGAVLRGDGDHAGVLEASASGTLVLGEIGELDRTAQIELVAALASARDVRLVATTWRDLRALVNRGVFHGALYHRVARVRVRMPTLAEREDDVKPLAQHFLGAIPWDVQAARAIASDALDALASRGWPSNVEELRRTIERLAMLAEGATITLEDLAFDRILDSSSESAPIEPFKEAKRTLVDAFERDYLVRLLARAGTNVSRAAALAGIERQSIRDLLRKHGLRGDEKD